MRPFAIYVCIVLCVAGGVGCNRIQPTMLTSKTTETQEPEEWLDAGKQAYKAGDVEFRVTGVRFGEPRVRELNPGEEGAAEPTHVGTERPIAAAFDP